MNLANRKMSREQFVLLCQQATRIRKQYPDLYPRTVIRRALLLTLRDERQPLAPHNWLMARRAYYGGSYE